MAETNEKITRDRLRAMRDGETITVACANGYALESQRNTVYAFQRLEKCRFTCKVDGLTLTVTRFDNKDKAL